MKRKFHLLLVTLLLLVLAMQEVYFSPAPAKAILGGSVSDAFSSVPRLQIKDKNYSTPDTCTGTLIDPNWILTAQHCTNNGEKQGDPVADDAITATFTSTANWHDGVTKIKSKKIIRMDGYNSEGGAQDVALIQLEHPVTNDIPSIRIIPFFDGGSFKTTQFVFRYGWGVTEPNNTTGSDVLKKSKEKLLTFDEALLLFTKVNCSSSNTSPTPPADNWVNDNSLFTQPVDGGSSNGDSGGPTFVYLNDGSYAIAGVTMGSYDLANCLDKHPDPRTLGSNFMGFTNRVDSYSRAFSFIYDNIPDVKVVTQSGTTTSLHQGGTEELTWNFSGDGTGDDFVNVDQKIKITKKADHTLWGQQFLLAGENSGGGSIHLETDSKNLDGSIGDTATFFMFNAVSVGGPNCDNIKLYCRIPFPIEENKWFKFRVWATGKSGDNQRWDAWMIDPDSGQEYWIGATFVPNTNFIGDVTNYTSYSGDLKPCNEVPQSISVFSQPAANNHADGTGTYAYYSSFAGWNKADCAAGINTPASFGSTLFFGGTPVRSNKQSDLQTAINQASTNGGIVLLDPTVKSIDLSSPLIIPPNVSLLESCDSPVTLSATFGNPIQFGGNNSLQGVVVQSTKGPLAQFKAGNIKTSCSGFQFPIHY